MSSNRNEYSVFPGIVTNRERNTEPGNIGLYFQNEDWNITQLLSMLPKHVASDNFDRKMAAAFSLELEREIQQKNSERISKKIK